MRRSYPAECGWPIDSKNDAGKLDVTRINYAYYGLCTESNGYDRVDEIAVSDRIIATRLRYRDSHLAGLQQIHKLNQSYPRPPAHYVISTLNTQ